MAGLLVLVVGSSGAGKDALIAAARERLAGDHRFVFPRRLVTREPMAALEDHETLSRAAFEAGRSTGSFALSWEAHGLGYALPVAVTDEIAQGRLAVVNVSRRVVADARADYPCRVVLVTADPALRAERLTRRGRESAADVEARMVREAEGADELAPDAVIDNSGALETAVEAFLTTLDDFSRL